MSGNISNDLCKPGEGRQLSPVSQQWGIRVARGFVCRKEGKRGLSACIIQSYRTACAYYPQALIDVSAGSMSGGKSEWPDQSPDQDTFFWSAIGYVLWRHLTFTVLPPVRCTRRIQT
jgi:hypothetical protein